MAQYDWNSGTQQTLFEGRQILGRTSRSIARSQQVALETEQIGTEVISELNDQRETLLRTKNRLTNADDQLDHSRSLLRKMSRNVFYNKIILICIIILEVFILGTLIYLKFFK